MVSSKVTEENVKTKMYALACEMGREGEWETEGGGQPPKSVFLGQIVLIRECIRLCIRLCIPATARMFFVIVHVGRILIIILCLVREIK